MALAKWIGVALVGAFALSGCQSYKHVPNPPPYTLSYHEHYSLLRDLHAGNVGVIEEGDTLRLLLPTDDFFLPGTTTLKPWRTPMMSEIATFIASYPNSPITVSGHTDNVASYNNRLFDSTMYAQAVASYLWHHGVDMKRVAVVGASDFQNVASNRYSDEAGQNRRVSIYVGVPKA